MKAVLSIFVLVGAIIVGAPAPAQQNTDLGRLEYEKGCIGCHGVDAKGSGVHTPRLKNDPPDSDFVGKDKWWGISHRKDIQSDRRERAIPSAWSP